ncbi:MULTISPECIES: alpha/beta fold hydrolase [Sorangium]|uniref:Alpha/beta hydrolase n=1 Tax=Sorangium cellulosum TaxID=56 RepID=A0A4P2QT67_SORCE|nr:MULTISPECIES: alpha/beta hydrolase [Sorangium]AUX33266.1 alpha/beta hydrolase [Sorangium cellulosum]WCQ92581.1 Epoxide hydrolase A [Sorangium sp. Soce836]
MTLDESKLSHRFTERSGVRLHYVEAGEGPLVVLLHGFPELWYSWRHQIPALVEAGYRVIAPDMRGYNLSDKPRGVGAYAIGELTADVAALIEASGAERAAAVVGHDWGGGVAWTFAMQYPALLERLVILNCPHPQKLLAGFRTARQLRKSWYMFFFQLPRVPELVAQRSDYALLREALKNDPQRPGAMSDDDLARYVASWSQPGALTATINYYRAMFRPGSLRGISKPTRVDVPVLVIWGEHDRYLGAELAAPDPELVPNARVARIPDASHGVLYDRPERVNQLLLEFLR